MKAEPINLRQKLSLFTEHWTPKIIGELNGQQVKLAKLTGDFIWHSHEHEDELFYILKGTLYMDFRDRTEVLRPGDMIIVPKGVEHKPRTEEGEEVHLMLFEPAATLHTGNVESDRTVNQQDWL